MMAMARAKGLFKGGKGVMEGVCKGFKFIAASLRSNGKTGEERQRREGNRQVIRG